MGASQIRRPDLLSGRYLLGDVIGRGGMGVVHRAWDTRLCRYVAVKILRQVAPDELSRERFILEGRTLAALNHPGLITLFDVVSTEDEPYLVMELVEGQSLKERCRESGMDVRQVAAIGAELADALAYVHHHQIVHRDLKPSNVLLADDGRVKLADFGIAQLIDNSSEYTPTGVTIGTVAYLSPEQVRTDPMTVASDIYSLGLVLLEALTGRRVFAGPPAEAALARLTRSPTFDATLPAPFRALIGAMTELDPTRRPAAETVALAFRAFLADTAPALDPTRPISLAPPMLPPGSPAVAEPRPRRARLGSPRLGGPARIGRPRLGRWLRPIAALTVAVAVVVAAPLSSRWGLSEPPARAASSASDPTVASDQTAPTEPDAVKAKARKAEDRAFAQARAELQAQERKLEKQARGKLKDVLDSAQKALVKSGKEAASGAMDHARKSLGAAARALHDALSGDQNSG